MTLRRGLRNLVLHVNRHVWLLLGTAIHDLNFALKLEALEQLLSLVTLTLFKHIIDHLQLVLHLWTVLEDGDIESLLGGDLLTIWSLGLGVKKDRCLRELSHGSWLSGNLLLSPVVDVHLWDLVIALIHKHVLCVSMLLIKSPINLPIELRTLAIIGSMLLHHLSINHELLSIDHCHALLIAILISHIEWVSRPHLVLVLLVKGSRLSDVHSLRHNGRILAKLVLHGSSIVHVLVLIVVLVDGHPLITSIILVEGRSQIFLAVGVRALLLIGAILTRVEVPAFDSFVITHVS